MSGSLGEFLSRKAEGEEPRTPDVNSVAVQPQDQAAAPENGGDKPDVNSVEAKPDGEQGGDEQRLDPPQQPEGRAAPQQDGEPRIPRRAYEDEKRKRQALETEAADLRRQMDEFRRQQQPQQQQAPAQFIDPREDPAGFIARTQQVMISNRLDVSEMMLRKEVGAETVERVKTEFMKAAEANPALYHELYRQPDPYAWAHQQVQAMEFQREIGGDPNAYREKLRAELMAEMQGQQAQQRSPPRTAVPRQQPSLSGARNSAARSAVPYSGPTPLEDILPGTVARR